MKSRKLTINPIRLGGCQFDRPRPKKILIFKCPRLRLCDLMTFTGYMRGSFWPNLELRNLYLNSKIKNVNILFVDAFFDTTKWITDAYIYIDTHFILYVRSTRAMQLLLHLVSSGIVMSKNRFHPKTVLGKSGTR